MQPTWSVMRRAAALPRRDESSCASARQTDATVDGALGGDGRRAAGGDGTDGHGPGPLPQTDHPDKHQQHRPSSAAPPVTSTTARHQHHRPRAKLTKPRADPSATTRQARPPEEGLLRPHRRPPLSPPSPTPPSPPPARPAPPPPSPPMTVSAPIPFPAAQRWPPPQKRRGSVRQQRGQGRRPRTPQPQPPQPSLLSHNSTMTQRKYTIYLI